MKFFCDQCNAQYMIADEKIGPRGVKVKCKKCTNVIHVTASTGAAAAASGHSAAGALAPAETGPAEPAAPMAAAEVATSPTAAMDTAAATAKPGPGSVGLEERAAAAPAGKVWFVAVGEAQLGPLDVAEVHQRWDAGDLHEDSLAWCAGMPDWIALSEIPEFTEWVAQRPRTAPEKADKGAAAAARGEGLGMAPASGVAWKPSAASALSSLMQEELLAAAAPKVTPKQATPAGVPDIRPAATAGMGDLFAAPTGPAAHNPAQEGAAHASVGGGAAWSVPAPRKAGVSPMIWGGLAFALLAVVGLGVFALRDPAPSQPAVATAPAAPRPEAAAQVLTSTPQPAPAASAPVAAPNVPAAAAGTVPAAPAAPQPNLQPNSEPPAAPRGADDADAQHRNAAHAGHRREHAPSPGRGNGSAPAMPAPAAAVKSSLGKEDIWGVVRSSASRVAPCIKAARARNEFPAGKYTFILDWTIRPDGAVLDPRLKGPAEVLSTSLPACFSASMLQWHFPASQSGAPIANFPFGPVNVP